MRRNRFVIIYISVFNKIIFNRLGINDLFSGLSRSNNYHKIETMELENLEVYQISMAIAERIWEISIVWSYFEKDTIGKQIVRASDSISANISEGFGRYHYNDTKNFLFYARGSLYETITWLDKAKTRNLIKEDDYNDLKKQCLRLTVKLNNFIKSIGKNGNKP